VKNESSDTSIYEIKKSELNSPIIFAGFVGAGLVGPLSVGCIIDKLEMEEILLKELNKLQNIIL